MQQQPGHSVVVEIQNNRTEIFFAPDFLLKELDRRTRYVSRPFAAATGIEEVPLDGFEVPMATPGTAWDGTVRLLRQPKTKPAWLPSGLKDIAVQTCIDCNVPHRVQDLRKPPPADIPHFFQPIPLWDHQSDAVEAILQSPDGVAVMPPRSGKTRTLFEVFRRINQPTIWVAPTTNIVRQTIEKAKEWFPGEYDVVELGQNPEPNAYGSLLAVTTAAAAIGLNQEFMNTRQCLICDEVHHFLADNTWGSTLLKLGEHIYYRYGMTGTFFRSGVDVLSLQAFLSRNLYTITTTELRDKGFLVPTKMGFIPVHKPKVRGKRLMHGDGTVGKLGIQEHQYRNECIARCAAHLGATLGRTVLILVSTKKQGNILKDRIAEMCPAAPPGAEFDSIEFVSTDRPKKVIGRILESFVNRGEVKMLIGTSMVGEGVDLPPADSLVYACGGKAAVQLVQGWFRVCTAAPGKKVGLIVDFADLHHSMIAEHSRERWKTGSTEPIFDLTYLESPEYFTAWASDLLAA